MRLLMCLSPESSRYNADGLLYVSHKTTDNTLSYLQIFKNGALEYGDSYILGSFRDNAIASKDFEGKIVQTFSRALQLLSTLQVPDPVYVSLTLIGVKGKTMALPYYGRHLNYQSSPFDRDLILCPDMLVTATTVDDNYSETLLPMVNTIWQAAGMEKSIYIRDDGQWVVSDPGWHIRPFGPSTLNAGLWPCQWFARRN